MPLMPPRRPGLLSPPPGGSPNPSLAGDPFGGGPGGLPPGLGGGGLGGPPPGLGGPPGLSGPPLGGPPGNPLDALGGGGGSQYPTTDPSAVAGLLGPLQAAQAQDQQQLQGQQMEATVLALIDAMRNQPNPAAQAAVTEPGYPTPPPAGLA